MNKATAVSVKKRKRPNPYEYFSVAADILVLRGNVRSPEVLLIQRKNPPFKNHWALPGGFLDREEDAVTAARRELWEETGIKCRALTEFGSFSDPLRDPRGRVVTISFFTYFAKSVEARAGDDAAHLEWFNVRRLGRLRLAFDHRAMIARGLLSFREK